MTLLVPDVGEDDVLQKWLNQSLTLKLYSNNISPAESDTAASYTEVSGGGYVAKTLIFADWVISGGIATYLKRDWTFTGAIGGSGIAYGYFIVDGSGTLLWAERFTTPYTPIANSLVRVTPKIQAT